MLLSNKKEDLNDDDFEASIESRIFTEVFFGYDFDSHGNGGLHSETINELFKRTENPLLSNSGNSTMTSQAEDSHAIEDLRENCAHWCSSEGDALSFKSDHDGNNQLMNLPTDELSCSGYHPLGSLHSSGPSKRVVFGISRAASPACDSVTYRLVESSTQGITSSWFSMKRLAKNDANEVDTCKSICSPVSQESSASKLLVASPFVNVVNNVKKTMKSSKFHKMSGTKVALDGNSINNPKPLLRNHFQDLLKEAGWEIRRRERENNISGEFLYYPPWRGKPIRELRRVWNLCGRKLFADAKIVLQEDDKQWVDMTDLWSDLSNTIIKIEEKIGNGVDSAALAQRWYLLDPFVNMAFIDKKLNTLKAGESVKARRSSVTGISKKNDTILPSDYQHIYGNRLKGESRKQSYESYVVDESALTASSMEGAGSWFKDFSWNKSRQSMSFSEAHFPDITYHLSDSCPKQVPITCEDADIVHGLSETKSLPCVYDKSSPGFNGKNFVNEDADLEAKENKLVVSFEAGNTCGCTTKSCKSSSICSSRFWKVIKQDAKSEKSDNQHHKKQKSSTCQLKDDDPFVSAIVKSKPFRSRKRHYSSGVTSLNSVARKKHKSKRGGCRLVPRSSIKGEKHNEGKWYVLNVRTVLSWLIDLGFISLGEVIQYRTPKNYTVVSDGLITWNGILCNCCSKYFSVSKFKNHAGFRLNRPCLDLFLESGKSFSLCQIEAWAAEYEARKSATRPVNDEGWDQNDDKCGLCGNMGELICCDNCPATFHQACLETQELPEGSWYCWHCCCRVCGDLVDDKVPQKSHGALMCLQCEQKYHRACLKKKGCRVVPSDNCFCCQSCEEVYLGLNSRLGAVNLLSDGLSWTLLKCTHNDQIIHSSPNVAALKAEGNAKLAVALTVMEECFLSMVDSRTGIDMIPHITYNLRSEYPRLNYNGFYTVVLEKDDVVLSVASIRIHGVAVAEMPLVATCSKYRRQGMCRRLLHFLEEMLKSLKVEKLVVSALPSLVETWTIGFGFIPMEDNERESLRDINLMVFPGTVWLKKRICESPKHIADETTNEMEATQTGSKNVQNEQDQDQQDDSSCNQFLDLAWEEPESSSVGRIRVDVGMARENFIRMSQKAHTAQDVG